MREAKFSLVGTPKSQRGVFYSSRACFMTPAVTRRRTPEESYPGHSRLPGQSHDEDLDLHIPLPCVELVYFSQLLHLTKRRKRPAEIQNLSQWRTVEVFDIAKSGKSI